MLSNYDTLFDLFYNTEIINEKNIYSNAIIKKAKTNKDTAQLISGYYLKSYMYDDHRVIVYSDSIINITKNYDDKNYPAAAYIMKGVHYNNKKNYKDALGNFITAHRYSKKKNNLDFINQCNHYIGSIKYRLGDNEEALKLFQKNHKYLDSVENENSRIYINSLFSLAVIFNELNKLDSAKYYNDRGLYLSKKNNHYDYEVYFIFNEGINEYERNNLSDAQYLLEKSVHSLEDIGDDDNLAMAHFYLGCLYNKKNRKEKSIISFKAVDSLYKKTREANPRFRDAYYQLVDHYKNEGDLLNQSKYLTTLIQIDSVIHENEVYLNKDVIKKYEIPNLIEERDKIIKSIRLKDSIKKKSIIILLVVLLILLIGYFHQNRKKKLYKKRFLQIIEKQKNDVKDSEKPKESLVIQPSNELDLSEEIVNLILKGLEDFEIKNEFLRSDMTLTILAKKIKTNTKYLSNIIKYYKKKTFVNYINDLRINYVINRLKEDSQFRKFTLQAISNEIGFKKTESFTKAFKKVNGITPSYFIQELNKKSN